MPIKLVVFSNCIMFESPRCINIAIMKPFVNKLEMGSIDKERRVTLKVHIRAMINALHCE